MDRHVRGTKDFAEFKKSIEAEKGSANA